MSLALRFDLVYVLLLVVLLPRGERNASISRIVRSIQKPVIVVGYRRAVPDTEAVNQVGLCQVEGKLWIIATIHLLR